MRTIAMIILLAFGPQPLGAEVYANDQLLDTEVDEFVNQLASRALEVKTFDLDNNLLDDTVIAKGKTATPTRKLVKGKGKVKVKARPVVRPKPKPKPVTRTRVLPKGKGKAKVKKVLPKKPLPRKPAPRPAPRKVVPRKTVRARALPMEDIDVVSPIIPSAQGGPMVPLVQLGPVVPSAQRGPMPMKPMAMGPILQSPMMNRAPRAPLR